MRKKLPHSGDLRTITKFLWFPKTINRERRWLEYAKYTQVYSHKQTLISEKYYWKDWDWIN